MEPAPGRPQECVIPPVLCVVDDVVPLTTLCGFTRRDPRYRDPAQWLVGPDPPHEFVRVYIYYVFVCTYMCVYIIVFELIFGSLMDGF